MSNKTKLLGSALCVSFLTAAAGTVAVGSAVASIYVPPHDIAALWLAATVSGVSAGIGSAHTVNAWKDYRREP